MLQAALDHMPGVRSGSQRRSRTPSPERHDEAAQYFQAAVPSLSGDLQLNALRWYFTNATGDASVMPDDVSFHGLPMTGF
ncbi:MAG: hypothetical protein ACRD0U_05225 [Acidimicrobiales bacterium]